MLTLKPKKRDSHFYLVYTPRQSRFTRDFYKGLTIAILFHVLLLVVFKVKTTLDPRPKPFLPFTTVMAEVGKGVTASILSQSSSLSPWDHEGAPMLPIAETIMPNTGLEFLEDIEIDFSSLEKLSYRELLQGVIDD